MHYCSPFPLIVSIRFYSFCNLIAQAQRNIVGKRLYKALLERYHADVAQVKYGKYDI